MNIFETKSICMINRTTTFCFFFLRFSFCATLFKVHSRPFDSMRWKVNFNFSLFGRSENSLSNLVLFHFFIGLKLSRGLHRLKWLKIERNKLHKWNCEEKIAELHWLSVALPELQKKMLAQLMDGSRGFFSPSRRGQNITSCKMRTRCIRLQMQFAVCKAVIVNDSVTAAQKASFLWVCARGKSQLKRRSKQTNLGDGQRNKTIK